MKMKALVCSTALAGLLAASPVLAADVLYSAPAPIAPAAGGPYFEVKGGANIISSDPGFATDAGDLAAGTPDTLNLDTGFFGSVAFGYAFGNRWGPLAPRLEVELGFLNNNVGTYDDDGPGVGGAVAAGQGQLNAFFGLTNLLFDIPVGWGGLTPYVGAGIGFANVRLDQVGTVGGTVFNSEDTAFAWDLTAGVSYDISRNVTFYVFYRFLQFNSVNGTLIGGGFTSSDDIDNHQVGAGIRVHL